MRAYRRIWRIATFDVLMVGVTQNALFGTRQFSTAWLFPETCGAACCIPGKPHLTSTPGLMQRRGGEVPLEQIKRRG